MIDSILASEATQRLAALRFFPGEESARAEIGDMLTRFVSTPQQLEWLIQTFMDQVGEWRGPKELRAVFCTRFKPADGIEAWSEIGGFTALDSEAQHRMEHPKPRLAEREGVRQLTEARKLLPDVNV